MDKDDARDYLLQTGEEGLVSWEEIARNCISALSSEDCLWIMQVYEYDDFWEDEDEDDYEYSSYANDDRYYTMLDWERDGALKIKVGQMITPDVYWQLSGSVPPTSMGKYFQPGEAYSHNANYEPLYMTFVIDEYDENGDPIYKYLGLQVEK